MIPQRSVQKFAVAKGKQNALDSNVIRLSSWEVNLVQLEITTREPLRFLGNLTEYLRGLHVMHGGQSFYGYACHGIRRHSAASE